VQHPRGSKAGVLTQHGREVGSNTWMWVSVMMILKPFSNLATVVFALVALAHLHRLLFEWEVLINGARMPMWTSVVGVLIAGLLAFGVWRESRQSKT